MSTRQIDVQKTEGGYVVGQIIDDYQMIAIGYTKKRGKWGYGNQRRIETDPEIITALNNFERKEKLSKLLDK